MAVVAATVILLATGSHAGSPQAPVVEDEELEGRATTAIELVPSVEAAFRRESYAPGEAATITVRPEPTPVTIRLFRVGPERTTTRGNNEMQGSR